MTLRNTEYRVTFASRKGPFYYYTATARSGWYQIASAGNRHRATAEKLLNHILSALARVKRGVEVTVE